MKKRRKPQPPQIIRPALFIAVVVLGSSLTLLLVHQYRSSHPSSFKSLSTAGWQRFTSPTTNVSFDYPASSKVYINAPSGDATPSSLTGNEKYLTIHVHSPNYSIDHSYQVSESDEPGRTLSLGIFVAKAVASDYTTQYEHTYVSLDGGDTSLPLTHAGAYDYRLLVKSDKWPKSMRILQCQHMQCRSGIERADQAYKYLSITVTADENWRHGGSPIDFTSPDYRLMQTILQTVRF